MEIHISAKFIFIKKILLILLANTFRNFLIDASFSDVVHLWGKEPNKQFDMKKIAFLNHSTKKMCFACALLLMAPMFTSCDLDDKEEPILIIEPPTGGFIIDKEGIPRRDYATSQLTEEEQRLITNELIGHGWKWLNTYEIDEHGTIVYQDYFKENPTARCCNYFFPSANEMTTFSYLYGAKEPGYFDWPIAIDFSNGDVRLNAPDNNYFLLNILSVFELDGQWYIMTIERLGMNGNGIGMFRSGFRLSEYVCMTDEELAKFQHDYSLDWRMVN